MNKRIILSKNKILSSILFCTFVVISWAPTTSNSTLGTDSLRAVTRILYFVAVFIVALMTEWRKEIPISNLLIALTPIVYYCFQNIYNYGVIKGSSSAMLLCTLFSLQGEDVRINVYKAIKVYLFFMASTGLICYLLYCGNIGMPYEIVPYYTKNVNNQWYINYGVSYLYQNSIQTRLCGLFNEPGWFGTFLAFYLCSEKLEFKKLSNIVVGIAGLLTFSLAFVLIVAIYYVAKQIEDWRKWILIVIFIGFYIFVLPNIETGNEGIDKLISRMELTEEGLSGDNRTTAIFDNEFERMINDKSIVFGKGYGYHLTIGAGSLCSIKTYIMDFGIIGTIFLFVPILFILAYKYKNNKKIIFFLICIAASLYQRPWLFETSNFFLTLAATSYIASEDIIEEIEILQHHRSIV